MANETVVLTIPGLDPGQMMFENVDLSEGPDFSVGEITKICFARSSDWLRWREKVGDADLEGTRVGNRTKSGARRYDLYEAEKLCHALIDNGAISPEQFVSALGVLRGIGRVYQLKPSEMDH